MSIFIIGFKFGFRFFGFQTKMSMEGGSRETFSIEGSNLSFKRQDEGESRDFNY